MNKTDLVDAIWKEAVVTKKDARKFVNAFIYVVTKALKNGEDVSLPGFGSLSVVNRMAMTRMNFQTQKPMRIPASRGIKFKIGKTLKDTINGR